MVHEVRVLVCRTELERAHQGRKAAVREGSEDEGDRGWCEWLVQKQERQLGSLRFENLGGIGKDSKRIRRVFDRWMGGRWGLKSCLEAVKEGLEI